MRARNYIFRLKTIDSEKMNSVIYNSVFIFPPPKRFLALWDAAFETQKENKKPPKRLE